jgi:hypothetical protein
MYDLSSILDVFNTTLQYFKENPNSMFEKQKSEMEKLKTDNEKIEWAKINGWINYPYSEEEIKESEIEELKWEYEDTD